MDYSGLNNLNRLELYYMSDISPDDFSDVATLEYLRLTYNYGSVRYLLHLEDMGSSKGNGNFLVER